MAKGYWIAHVDVRDASEYDKYRAANADVFAKFGAKFLVRGAPQDVRVGACRARSVVIEFPSLEAAQECYDSPEYQAAKAIRTPVSDGNMCIIEGYDG
jgi:uncharacterized protein (DUF1330 family)